MMFELTDKARFHFKLASVVAKEGPSKDGEWKVYTHILFVSSRDTPGSDNETEYAHGMGLLGAGVILKIGE